MITYWFILFLQSNLKNAARPITFLPDVNLSISVLSNIEAARGYLAIVYTVIPAATIAMTTALILMATFEISIGVFKVVKWVYKKIPGIS